MALQEKGRLRPPSNPSWHAMVQSWNPHAPCCEIRRGEALSCREPCTNLLEEIAKPQKCAQLESATFEGIVLAKTSFIGHMMSVHKLHVRLNLNLWPYSNEQLSYLARIGVFRVNPEVLRDTDVLGRNGCFGLC
jgi:hypothetical protein